MAGVDEFDLDAGHDRHGALVADRLELRERPGRVYLRIQGQRGMMLRVPTPVGGTGVFFLDPRRVGKHERAQVLRRRRAEDAAAESLRNEPGQEAAMVQMRVGQDDRVDAGRVERQGGPVPKAKLLQALEQSAVDEHTMVADIQQMFGAGDRTGGSKKRQRRHALTILNRMTARRLAVPIVLLLMAPVADAQQKLLTLDDLYGPATRINFSGTPASGFVWIDATHYAWPRPVGTDRQVEWVKVDAETGASAPLFSADRMQTALEKLPGVSASDARRAAHARSVVFDHQHARVLVTLAGDLYLYRLLDDEAVRLTSAGGEEREPTFSPDGSKVAFVRDNNLVVVDVARRRETALTSDGSATILNGRLDWVYEEEIYGRGHPRAYWWSPDSSRLAFLRIDDGPVSSYLTVDDIPYAPVVETWRYPRAGDPNPVARLGVVRASGGAPAWVDLSRYSGVDHLVVRVGWTSDSAHVAYEVQDRTQTWLDLNIAPVDGQHPRTIVHESSKYWIGSDDVNLPTWLNDGSFLWLDSRTGWPHLYHYKSDGTLLKQLTDGPWEVRSLEGVDERAGHVYFSGTERSAIGTDVYRVNLDGTGLRRVSEQAGTHDADFSPTFLYYLDTWSDATTPPQVALHRGDGSAVRVVDANPVPALSEYRLSKPEFVHVPTRDGFQMEAMMIRPPGFDPSRRYPVYQFTYGGPHEPQVRDAWNPQYMYHQLLAQKGIIVWICDNRSASGKGVTSTFAVHRRFGESELRDIEDGLDWLTQQPYVDASRIGIHGWSYGGFMTAYALTHSTRFAMGIAGGTVADWRDYDSVYTERYLGLPKDNPEGYRNSSPRWTAASLHGALLLIHGEIDDNVHPQNTMQLAYELQKANKPFRLMLYPKSRHGVTDPALVRHMRGVMLDFTLEQLKP